MLIFIIILTAFSECRFGETIETFAESYAKIKAEVKDFRTKGIGAELKGKLLQEGEHFETASKDVLVH